MEPFEQKFYRFGAYYAIMMCLCDFYGEYAETPYRIFVKKDNDNRVYVVNAKYELSDDEIQRLINQTKHIFDDEVEE